MTMTAPEQFASVRYVVTDVQALARLDHAVEIWGVDGDHPVHTGEIERHPAP